MSLSNPLPDMNGESARPMPPVPPVSPCPLCEKRTGAWAYVESLWLCLPCVLSTFVPEHRELPGFETPRE